MSTTPVEDLEVGDLDPAALLALAESNEREIRRREALKLRIAYQWAVLHPLTPETGVETPGGPAFDVLDQPESLGGDGTPAVAAFTPEPFALAVGISPGAGAALIGDVLDLVHRHPILWKRVQALSVPAWQARRVAQQTRRLPIAGARWVDDQLACRTDGSLGPVITDRLVARAAAQFDPETHQAAEHHDQAGWGIDLTHPNPTAYAGSSDLTARGDTPTIQAFRDLVATLAHQLLLDGDTSPLGVRQITALRLLTKLATSALAGDQPGQQPLDLDLDQLTRTLDKQAGKIKLIALVNAEDLEVTPDGETAFATGQVERLGAATLARLRQWAGHQAVQILPVLNLYRRDAVDSHDPPDWMAELVRLRDEHCIFPRCTVPARDCDLEHEIPYLPLEEGGPPGQTRPDGLACVCRRHHRAKTSRRWRYHRTPDGYLWHGPHAKRYLVTPSGTTNL